MSLKPQIEEVRTDPDDGRVPIRASPKRILIEFMPNEIVNINLELNGVSPVFALGWMAIVNAMVLGIQDQLMQQQRLQQQGKSVTLANVAPPAPDFKRRG